MVIGAFFSEAGTELLKIFWKFDAKPEYLEEHLILDKNWKQADYYKLKRIFSAHHRPTETYVGKVERLCRRKTGSR